MSKSKTKKKTGKSKVSIEGPFAFTPGTVSKTGIKRLDEALNGGIPKGSCVLLAGGSGTGKTILAMQWLFNGFHKFGETGVYITTTEPVFKAANNLRAFEFFDVSMINPLQVHMTDLRNIMQDLSVDYASDEMTWEDVENILSIIKNIVEGMNAKRLVLDSITAICYRLRDENLIRNFIFRLGTMLSNLDCTTILTSEVASEDKLYSPFGIEEFISDGIIKLKHVQRGENYVRSIRVVKMRGTNFDSSPMYYRITKKGYGIFSEVPLQAVTNIPSARLKSGITGLDKMLGGGFHLNSTTLVSGSSGTGKSLFGIQYLKAGTDAGQKALLISYEESRAQIFRNAKLCPGIDMEKLEKKKKLKVVSEFPENLSYEEHLQLVKKHVETFKPDRVVIDSLSSLEKIFSPENLLQYARRINFYLKYRGCTSIFISASKGLFENTAIAQGHLSTIPDNIILLKYVELESTMRRFITVLKVRGSDHDKTLRQYVIQNTGIKVKKAFKGIQGMLSGNIHKDVRQEEVLQAFKDLSSG